MAGITRCLLVCLFLGKFVCTRAARIAKFASGRGSLEHEGSGEKDAKTKHHVWAPACNKSPPKDKGYAKGSGALVLFSRADKYRCKKLLRGNSNEWIAQFSFQGETDDRVVKVSKLKSQSSQNAFVREARTLDSLSHNEKSKRFFPELLYWFKRKSSGSIYMVTKFLNGAQDFPADATYSKALAKQMCDAYISAWQLGYAIGDTGSVGNRAIANGRFKIMDVGTAVPISDKSLDPDFGHGSRFMWKLKDDIDQLTIYGFRQLTDYPPRFDAVETAGDFLDRKRLWEQHQDVVVRQVIKWLRQTGNWCHFG